jgi:hypothetical protein
MTPQNSPDGEPRSPDRAILADRLISVPRTGRIVATSPAKQQTQAQLVRPDPQCQDPTDDLLIQALQDSFQTSAPVRERMLPRPPRSAPPPTDLARRARRPQPLPSAASSGGTPPGEASSPGSAVPLRPPSGSRRRRCATDAARCSARTRQRAGSPTVDPRGTPARSLVCSEGCRHGLALPRASASHAQAQTALPPAACQDGTPALRAHPNPKPMGPASATSIGLKRSLHDSTLPEYIRRSVIRRKQNAFEAKPVILTPLTTAVNLHPLLPIPRATEGGRTSSCSSLQFFLVAPNPIC